MQKMDSRRFQARKAVQSMSDVSNRNPKTELGSEQPWFVLSAARHYDLITSQDPAISHFYSFEADQSQGLTFAIPDGCIDILFDCSAPQAKVCGTTLAARSADLTHQHRYFGIRFAMGVMPDFLQTDIAELIDKEVNWLELAPNSDSLLAQITEQTDARSQAKLFEGFINGRSHRQTSALTHQAMKLLRETHGNLKINDLETHTGYSRRTLQRQFAEDLGLSPKTFSRIVLCQNAIHDINRHTDVVLSDLAFDLGFSDQSHFQREFKKFVNATPVEYLNKLQGNGYQERIRRV